MLRCLILFSLICPPLVAEAQYSLRDTFRHYLSLEPDLYISLDGMNSFVRDQPAQIDGLRFGLSYGGKIRLLTGIYRLHTPITREYTYAPGTVHESIRKQVNRFTYWGLTCDYVLFNRGPWKLALPLQSGVGFGSRVERDPSGEVVLNERFRFVPLTLCLNTSFRITPWFYASAGLGYRYAIFSRTVSSDFSAPVYSYGLGIDLSWFWEKYGRHLVTNEWD